MSARTERWLARADRLEDHWRHFAFLGLTDTLHITGGHEIEVRLLTLRMFVQLCAVRSPFLIGRRNVEAEDIAILLWRLSPRYDMRDDKRWLWLRFRRRDARKEFMRSIQKFPFRATLRACNRYLDRMLIDAPPSSDTKTRVQIDTSFAATMVHQIAQNYGWSDDQILDLPIPRLFQYMRKIHRNIDNDLAYFNPIRDKFVHRIMDKILATRKAQ